MKSEPIYTKGKYALFAECDDYAQGPYECDFEPPMMRFSGRTHYERVQRERELYAYDISKLLEPKHCDTREKREALLKIWERELDDEDTLDVMSRSYYNIDGISRLFLDWIKDQDFDEPSSWRGCIDFFDRLEELCEIVGLACINEQSNGYSQGASYRVFMVATPEWLKETGCDGDDIPALKENLMCSFRQWSAWVWGDVYGYVIREVVSNSAWGDSYSEALDQCWGFYSDDHNESGLLEAGIESIDCIIEKDNKEAAAAYEAACRDIVTV